MQILRDHTRSSLITITFVCFTLAAGLAAAESAHKAEVWANRGGHATIELGAPDSGEKFRLVARLVDEETGQPLDREAAQVVLFVSATEKYFPVDLEELNSDTIRATHLVRTDGDGRFELRHLPVGRYSLQVPWDRLAEMNLVRWELTWVEDEPLREKTDSR